MKPDPEQRQILKLESLAIRYGKNEVLAELSLELQPGQVYALLGPNGAGKSSLIRCLLGMQRPQAGSVQVLEQDPWKHRTALLRRLSFVPEKPDAPNDLTLQQLAAVVGRLYPTWDQAYLDDFLGQRKLIPASVFGELSRGQKTQVQLGLALAAKPELLILDDPTLGLDAAARRWVFDGLIQDLHDHGTTVFLTTHDLSGVETLADRIGVLHRGRLLVNEPLEDLKGRFRRLLFPRAAGVADVPNLAALAPVATHSSPWGLEVILDRGSELEPPPEASISSMSLEQIFLALTKQHEGGSV